MTHTKISTRSSVLATAIRSPFYLIVLASVVALGIIGLLIAHS